MPYTVTAEELGQRVKAKYPGAYDDKDDAEVGRAMSAKHPDAYQLRPSLPAHPPVDMQPRTLKSVTDAQFANNPGPGQPGGYDEALRLVGNAGRRTLRNLIGPLDFKAMDANFADAMPNPIPGYLSTARDQGVTQALSDIAGDVGSAYVLGKGGEALPEAAATSLNALGRGTRKAGSLVSRVAASAPSPVDALGADAGSALSRNRIVGAGPRSLARKVNAKVGPASEARDTILAQSTAPTTDVEPIIAKPFAEIVSAKTNPKTGAAQPSSLRRADTTRRAIQELQSPEGELTGQPKDSNLSPLEMSQLQRNVYGMTDYTTPESDLANTGLKGAGAGLKDAINAAAPEASSMTDALHDLMGAKEHLDARAARDPGEVHSLTQMGVRMAKGAKVLGGTAAGAGLDVLGSGMEKLGGAIRHAGGSPVAPTAPAPPPMPQAPAPGLPAPPPTAPAAPTPRALAAQVATSPTPSPSPELNLSTARNRTAPAQFSTPDIPPARGMVAGPEGVTPRRLALESTTGRGAPSTRPSLLSRMKADIEAAAAPPPPSPTPASTPVKAKPTLKSKMAAPLPRTNGGLPAPTDIDAWEALVDEGKARYNTHTHSYDYIAPPTPGGRK